jgi:O-antigen chain-terminating methyltransferase
MVDACLAQGLNARCTDALTFLRSLPTGSVAAVTGFHIIEHLPFDYLFALVQESYRVLVEGGSVLFETPNPENVLVGSHTFYHDFTHRNPVTPSAISFLLKYHRFEAIDIIRSSPYPEEAKVPGNDPLTERVNGHLCGPQDFAVLGRKQTAAGVHA